MAEPKKYGTFSGVFTPAVLTILGVIMYLRLPWIVGQAGLFMTIGIILGAHVISVTTGLSVASLATDRKVKVGGAYYMISRSLGLPIGGTLGLALFMGLSFSISLYLIGFSESLLGYLGYPVTKDTIRLAGSIALLAVTAITLISTSLALKTQFIILIAIVLSLASILAGKPTTLPDQPNLLPAPGSSPFILFFGIFFPAVTGFTAGVSMSGDLKDPKKAIPAGTVGAIVLCLAVYIGLAAFFSYRVPAEQLRSDPNILLNISLFPPLVLAGIWGATISSAMGSILGAPRTLQAISMDRITPRIFGRGYGKANEPRNALVLTFLIAEAGILIGDLDVIARLVSMFFVTIYGFLNLSCAIEDWASPDFQPELRIPRWVNALGAITCLIVMIQLDLLAMVFATLLLGSLFFYLKRKELTLESGDTWEGVWSSVIRTGLQHLDRHVVQRRNWRPNIILFSGGTQSRPHLIDLGKRLVDKRGMLSNFDLIETEGSKLLFRKSEQSLQNQVEEFPGVFSRRIECDDIFSAMETISKYYGFSGLEPNTVLMGWGKNSEKPERFVRLLRSMMGLDYNLMLLNYDRTRGFGRQQKIDIWWGGIGNNISLALSLARFLLSSDEWRGADIRLITITEDSSLTEELFRSMNGLIQEYRLEAAVKVVNNAVEQQPFYDIMIHESAAADLTVIGIPALSDGEEQVFVSKNNTLIESLGTVLLIHASSFFNDVEIGLSTIPALPLLDKSANRSDGRVFLSTGLLADGARVQVKGLSGRMLALTALFRQNCLERMLISEMELIVKTRSLICNSFESIEKNLTANERLRNYRTVTRALGDFLFQANRIFEELNPRKQTETQEILANGISSLLTSLQSSLAAVPESIRVERSPEITRINSSERWSVILAKLINRFSAFIRRKPITTGIRINRLSNQFIGLGYLEQVLNLLEARHITNQQHYSELQKMIDRVSDSLGNIGKRLRISRDVDFGIVVLEKNKILKSLDTLSDSLEERSRGIANRLNTGLDELFGTLVDELNRFDSHRLLVRSRRLNDRIRKATARVNEMPELWQVNERLMSETAVADMRLLSFKNRVGIMVQRNRDSNRLAISSGLLDELKELSAAIEAFGSDEKKATFTVKDVAIMQEYWTRQVNEIRSSISELPESVDLVVFNEPLESSEAGIVLLQTTSVSLQQLVDYFFETEYIGPVNEELNRLTDLLQKALFVGRDVQRLISIQESLEQKEGPSPELETTLKDSRERVEEALSSVMGGLAEFEAAHEECLKNAFSKLNLYSLSKSSGQVEWQIREKKGIQTAVTVNNWIRRGIDRVVAFNTQLVYRRATAVNNLGRPDGRSARSESDTEAILNIVESTSPRMELVSQLPFYYRHLFLGDPVISKDFWLGRQAELLQAQNTITRFKNGIRGGLAIIGDPGSGKTALSRFIAARHFEKSRQYFLTAPESGSIDVDLFRWRLNEVLGSHEPLERTLEKLPPWSVIILDDIARWWERSQPGDAVINEITRLIDQHGDKCLFIVTVDGYTFHFINRLSRIEDHFLSVINCQPYDIESLKQIIMLRHRSAGLKFKYLGTDENEMSDWQIARLFATLLRDCAGNISRALHRWIHCIASVDRDNIRIEIPMADQRDLDRYLHNDQVTLLIQFLLHGNLDRIRLQRIFRRDGEFLNKLIGSLKRSGILQETARGLLQLNTFMRPHIYQKLIDKGLL